MADKEVSKELKKVQRAVEKAGDFSAEKAKRAAQLSFEKYCSVSKTLEPTAKINHHIILNGDAI